jgi:hypothetical protein
MKLETLKKQQRPFYDSIVSVYCPVISDTVYFTAKGYNHLIYESNRKPRKVDEQFLKLKSLSDAPEVIKNAKGISDTQTFERRIPDRYGERTVKVLLLGLEHEVKKNYKVRVVIEKIGMGKYHFLSVMPCKKRPPNPYKNKKRSQ